MQDPEQEECTRYPKKIQENHQKLQKGEVCMTDEVGK